MAHKKPRLLVIDDGETYAKVVIEQMPEFELVRPPDSPASIRISDGHAALSFLKRYSDRVDLVLLDMHFDVPENRLLQLTPQASVRRTKRYQGVAILREIRKRLPALPVVLLTAIEDLSLIDADGELACQSMTYFFDGEDVDSLRISINSALQESTTALEESNVLWGSEPVMRALRRRLTVLAKGSMPVILEGETGTGKSYLAENFLHRNSGRKGPFVTIDLSTVSYDLIPAHLFGSLRGAYTGSVVDRKGAFEAAHKGTLFIDEIQNIPLPVQKQLLRVLQEGRVRPLGSTREIAVDVKVVAASNMPLEKAVAEKRFRSDLYMRLSPATRVTIPNLTERIADLKFLASQFVRLSVEDPNLSGLWDRITRSMGLAHGCELSLIIGRPRKDQRPKGLQLVLPEPSWRLLKSHRWPGNIRELSMVMYNLVAFTLVGAADALHAGMSLRSTRLQVDPGLVGQLLAGTQKLTELRTEGPPQKDSSRAEMRICLQPDISLNAVAQNVERQYLRLLFNQTQGDFAQMAERLLGDAGRTRAVRLRFNQLGLKVRELRNK